MNEFERIRTFVDVVKAGSFSAAARDRSSISSVARQVKSLEEELGVRLLNRSTRSLSLTEPGMRFYERACGILNDLNNAKSDAQSYQDSVKGVLKVSIRTVAGTTIIVPALPKLLERYPELTIEVTLSDEMRDLISNNIDVAVWMGHIPNAEIVARRLSPTKRIVCGSPAYLARCGVPQVPQDLTQHNCLLFSARSYSSVWTFGKGGNSEQVAVHGNFRSDNGLVLLSAAQADLGLIIAHEWMVRSLLMQGRMIRVLGEYSVHPRPGDAELHVVYASSRGLSRKIRVFVDFLVELFQPEGSSAKSGRGSSSK